MLNSTNALEGHIPPAESAALMVAEEKPHPDSCKACQPDRQQFYHHLSLSHIPATRQTIPQTWL
ncbi:GSCOCG00002200001-RA-CDS [Cotesia congregata]|nr:GSCOCG00002200001-RA-CDS [Cotesia congregata]